MATIVLERRNVTVLGSTQVLTAGSKRPVLGTCLLDDGEGHSAEQYVLKPTGPSMSPAQVCAEVLASRIAAAMGLQTPTALALTLDADGAAALSRASRVVPEGPCFGSVYADGAAVLKDMGSKAPVDAWRIFILDYCVQNRDRLNYNNPNALLRSGRLIAIDHDQTFDFCVRGGTIEPPRSYMTSAAVDAHVFRKQAEQALRRYSPDQLLGELETRLAEVDVSLVSDVERYCTGRIVADFDWNKARARILDLKQNVDKNAEALASLLV